MLDKVYNWDYIDTDYQKRRENTVIISTRCDQAGTHCFCTSLDYDVENLDAMDVVIVNGADGKRYIKARTPKGENFLTELNTEYRILNIESQMSEEDKYGEMKKQYESFTGSFRLKMDYKEVNAKLSKIFDTPEFENVSGNCVRRKRYLYSRRQFK